MFYILALITFALIVASHFVPPALGLTLALLAIAVAVVNLIGEMRKSRRARAELNGVLDRRP